MSSVSVSLVPRRRSSSLRIDWAMLLTCGSGDWGRARSWHRSAVAAGGRQLGVAAVPWCPHRRLALIRTMLVALIAISVAALPAASEAIISSYPAEITMADQADMPCCPCCNTQGDFKATACVLKCVALAGAVLPEIVRCAAICRRRLSAFSCGRYGQRSAWCYGGSRSSRGSHYPRLHRARRWPHAPARPVASAVAQGTAGKSLSSD
jgi:hypothetical protein